MSSNPEYLDPERLCLRFANLEGEDTAAWSSTAVVSLRWAGECASPCA